MSDQARQSIKYHIDRAAELVYDSESYNNEDDALLAIWDAQSAQARALIAIAKILQAWRLESKEANNANSDVEIR